MEKVLIELVKSGVPAAQRVIMFYYLADILSNFFVLVGVLGVAFMGYRLTRIWQKYIIDEAEASRARRNY